MDERMSKIIFKGQDNSIAIMSLAPGAEQEDAIKKFQDSHPKGFYDEYYKIDLELPLDREFRDAWTLKDNKIVVDNKKAMSIHLERIRAARNAALENLDKEQLRWMHAEDMQKLINDRKQELRDLPAKIKSLDWPEGLSK